MKQIKGANLYYMGVEVIYDNTYPEDYDGTGQDEYPSIENARVSAVDISIIVQYHYHYTKKEDNIFNAYAIDRILRANRVYDPANWDVKVSGGYYGDEIDGVFLNEEIASRIDSQYSSVFFLKDDNFKVEELLRIEYGKLLPELENRNWTIEKVDKSSIKFASKHHYDNLRDEDVARYKDYKGIRAIIIPQGDSYRIIDGYHRLKSARNGKIKVLVGREK